MNRWQRLLAGTEVVCIASGPSLTLEDVETVRRWRVAQNDRRVIVTNTTFRVAPWADVLYAMDRKWWSVYLKEIRKDFKGELATNSGSMCREGWKTVQSELRKFKPFGNSGAAALSLACRAGARRVVLLGYDCQHTGGKAHHHGNHPRGMGNARSVQKWPAQFRCLRGEFPKVEILNATRITALKVFPLVELDVALTHMEKVA